MILSKVHFTDRSYSQSTFLVGCMTLMQAVLLIMSCDIVSHLNQLVLVKGAEEKLGLDALLQSRSLLVRLGVDHLHILTLIVLGVVRLATFQLFTLESKNLLLIHMTNFAAASALG